MFKPNFALIIVIIDQMKTPPKYTEFISLVTIEWTLIISKSNKINKNTSWLVFRNSDCENKTFVIIPEFNQKDSIWNFSYLQNSIYF